MMLARFLTHLLLVAPVLGTHKFCCPNDPTETYYGPCQGCLLIDEIDLMPNHEPAPLTSEAECLAMLFFNYPGGDAFDAIGYPPKIQTDCEGVVNELCCCDYTGTNIIPNYKYEACDFDCYIFNEAECEAQLVGVEPRPGEVLPVCEGVWRTAECEAGCDCLGDPHFKVNTVQCHSFELTFCRVLPSLPLLKTWAGDYYDYHGECDLVLLTTDRSDLGPLDIHVR